MKQSKLNMSNENQNQQNLNNQKNPLISELDIKMDTKLRFNLLNKKC